MAAVDAVVSTIAPTTVAIVSRSKCLSGVGGHSRGQYPTMYLATTTFCMVHDSGGMRTRFYFRIRGLRGVRRKKTLGAFGDAFKGRGMGAFVENENAASASFCRTSAPLQVPLPLRIVARLLSLLASTDRCPHYTGRRLVLISSLFAGTDRCSHYTGRRLVGHSSLFASTDRCPHYAGRRLVLL